MSTVILDYKGIGMSKSFVELGEVHFNLCLFFRFIMRYNFGEKPTLYIIFF